MARFIIGDILTDNKNGLSYRFISVNGNIYIGVQLQIKKLMFEIFEEEEVLEGLSSGVLDVISDSNYKIVDLEKLTAVQKTEYLKRKSLMAFVLDMYGDRLIDLSTKRPKPELVSRYEGDGYSRQTFRNILCRYFQSGFKDYSLVNANVIGREYQKNVVHNVKHGRKGKYITAGKPLDEEDYRAMDNAIKYFKSIGCTRKIDAFDWMNVKYYSDGNGVLLPIMSRPTRKQFDYYVGKMISKEEIDRAKKGVQEQRNNNRLLLSDTLYNNDGPGDVCEVDACEIDFSSVGIVDRTKSPGRCTAYFMIDVYSKCIVAAYVGYEVNSIPGTVNLLLNLGDDKQKFCRKYGAEFKTDDLFPSGFIPRRILLDRGSDFISTHLAKICEENRIVVKWASPGLGSMKGNVEQSFHQFMSQLRQSYDGKGLITGEHGSRPHKNAVATVNDFMKHIIAFVFTHNSKYNASYELSAEQMNDRVRPIPSELWKYGCEHKTAPRRLNDLKQYFYSLLIPVNAYISRKGIYVDDTQLYYINGKDKALFKECYTAQNKHVKFKCKYDPRDISRLYYMRDGELCCAVLNPEKHANIGVGVMTFDERIAVLKEYKQIEAKGNVYNENIRAVALAMNTSIVKNAEAETGNIDVSDKNMRENRLLEKEYQKKSNTIVERLEEQGITASLPMLESEQKNITESTLEQEEEFDFEKLEMEYFLAKAGYKEDSND